MAQNLAIMQSAGDGGRHNDTGGRIVRMPHFVKRKMTDVFYEVEQVNSADFGGVFLCSELGEADIVYSSSWGSPARIARTEYAIRNSPANVILLVLGVAGNAELSQSGRTTMLSRGSLAIVDSSKPYEISVPKGWKAIWLKVPRAMMESRLFTYADWLGRSLDTREGLAYAANCMIHACLHASKMVEGSQSRFLAAQVLDLACTAFANADDAVGAGVQGRSRHTEGIFNRVDRFIEGNIQNPSLGPALISRACGVSERYLRQLFASRGTTMTTLIRSKRLEECRRLLNGYGHCMPSVTEVAFSLGFENISSFNRAFKAHFGMTPRQVRSQNAYGHGAPGRVAAA
ncbi:helix-turn-helix domain-containing protein [Sphingobium sp.]|uniref:helix-turn-helix domain-containing protein n=1 Tax=Sphingobium sp. TaxID=1912891 RepID=UPI003B3A45A3